MKPGTKVKTPHGIGTVQQSEGIEYKRGQRYFVVLDKIPENLSRQHNYFHGLWYFEDELEVL